MFSEIALVQLCVELFLKGTISFDTVLMTVKLVG